MNGYALPRQAVIGGRTYHIHGDFRDILEIFQYLIDPDLPEGFRWQVALGLFYDGQIPEEDRPEAIRFLCDFIRCGQQEQPGPRLLDWQQDAGAIMSGVNAVAGQEIRAMPFVHWWTFLSWFSAIGQGELSTVVAIRSKLSRGQRLTDWEQDYYRQNRQKVELQRRYSASERLERERLERMLG